MIANRLIYSPKISASQAQLPNGLNQPTNETEQPKVIRKFINSAIYVEKPIMPPLRKRSPIFINSLSNDERTSRRITTDRSIKKCTCITSPKNCHCHPPEQFVENISVSSTSSSSTDVDSQITVKSKKKSLPKINSEMNLSLCSLPTQRTGNIDPKEKEEIIKNWLKKKNQEKKKREQLESKIREAKERQRELMLEKERENFKKWLANKKLDEEKERKEKERKEEENRVKEAEKQKKHVQNELSYHTWLRKKKRAELEKNIKEKLALLQFYEEKQKRMEENEEAFNTWLKSSKNKPKPVPLNQGLQSLCSSTSVTYINPVPWIPNVELSHKPVSQ